MPDTTDRLDQLTARLDALEAENADLRARLDAVFGASGPEATAITEAEAIELPTPDRFDRRQAIRRGLGLAGAAAAGAVLADASPVAAANGNNVIIGQNNTGTLQTTLAHTGSGNAFAVTTTSSNGTAVRAAAPNGGGLITAGKKFHVRLEPVPGRGAPQGDNVTHNVGEIVIDTASNVWICVATGNPGTWRQLSGPTTVSGFRPFNVPVRVYDSRPGTTPATGPKTKVTNLGRTIDLRANGGISPGASAVLVSVLLVNAASGVGNFTIWSAEQIKPASNTMVWGGNTGRHSTLAFTRVDNLGRVKVHTNSSTDVVLDVIGQYL